MDTCLSWDHSKGAEERSAATLLAVADGDRHLLLRVTRSVTGFLIRSGAYDVRDSWDDLCQDVLIADPTDWINDRVCDGCDAEILLDMRRAFAGLDERHRRVIHAIYIQGYSYEQAAERLALPLGTLKRRQTAALRLLRQRLAVVKRAAA